MNHKSLNAKTIIFAAMFALVLIVVAVLAIVLLSRGLGNTAPPPITTKVVSSSADYLPPYICPQELKVVNGTNVAITEGHLQFMTQDIYNWVKDNCVYNGK